MPGTPFNLIREDWLPVRRADGSRLRVAPWRIVEGLPDNPIVAVDWPRPDFNGATLEFLIGLLATAFAPRDIDQWLDRWEQPPTPEALRAAFERVAFAFDLDGDGQRFMQEFDELSNSKDRTIEQLLIDHPGEITREENRDLFIKRDSVRLMCRPAAAIAIFAMQTYSPGVGPGFRASLRLGGPLTTLVFAPGPDGQETVWSRCWANTPEYSSLPDNWDRVFPWLSSLRSSENDEIVTPAMRADQQVFWGMPRRVRLVMENAEERTCDLTGWKDSVLASGWKTRQYGEMYRGWRHPLSPYDQKKGNPDKPVTGDRVTGFFRDWLGLVNKEDKGIEAGRQPASCVNLFPSRADAASINATARLVAFGYHMERNAAAVRWHQSEMPIRNQQTLLNTHVQAQIAQLVHAAEVAVSAMGIAAAYCLMSEYSQRWTKKNKFVAPGPAKIVSVAKTLIGKSNVGNAMERFWASTEQRFYEHIIALNSNSDDDAPLREGWLATLRLAALAIFDDVAPSEGIEEGAWKRLVEARKWLGWNLDGNDIRATLGLAPPPERTTKGGRKTKGKTP